MLKRYLLYLVRWQLSTPLLAVCLIYFAKLGSVWSTIIANLIGGLIFFWVDRYILSSRSDVAVWSIKSSATCVDCGRTARAYRLVVARNYDRTNDPEPEYRCEECSIRKAQTAVANGVVLE